MALVTGNVTGILDIPAGALNSQAALDRQSSLLVAETHGKYFAAARAGRIFMATTVIAGVVLPVAAGTLNSKFTLHNPANSGVIVEPVSFVLGIDSATTVVNGVGLAIQRALGATSGIPTSTTAATVLPLGVGGLSKCAVYTQATLTNVAIPGVSVATAVPIPFYNMFSFGAVTAPVISPCDHNFDGRLTLSPDDLAAVCTTVAASTASFCGIIWAEWTL